MIIQNFLTCYTTTIDSQSNGINWTKEQHKSVTESDSSNCNLQDVLIALVRGLFHGIYFFIPNKPWVSCCLLFIRATDTLWIKLICAVRIKWLRSVYLFKKSFKKKFQKFIFFLWKGWLFFQLLLKKLLLEVHSCKLKKHWWIIAYGFSKYPDNFAFQLFIILQ